MQERRHGTAAGIDLACSARKQVFELHSGVETGECPPPFGCAEKAVVVRWPSRTVSAIHKMLVTRWSQYHHAVAGGSARTSHCGENRNPPATGWWY